LATDKGRAMGQWCGYSGPWQARAEHGSNAFLQPFLAYKNAWTFTVSTESTYDWRNED
jgi:hypothetical protein